MQKRIKNISYLFSGNILALLIPYLVSPFLARIYSVEDFGEFGQFMAWASVISIIASGGFEYSIILPKNEYTAKNLLLLGFLSNLLTITISLIGIFLLHLFVPEISKIYFLLPFVIFVLASQRLLNFSLNRFEKYKNMALANSSRALFSSPLQYLFFIISKNMSGLLLGDLIGQMIKLLILIKSTKHLFKKRKLSRINLLAIKRVYKKFPYFAMPSELINHLSIQLPILLLIYFYGAEAAGLYFLPHKLLSAPLNALGNAVSQIYFKESNNLKTQKTGLANLSEKLYKTLFLLGIFPFSILFFFGPEIFSLIFGHNWELSGTYASYISPWLFLVFVFSPLSIIFTVFEKLKLSLKLNTILLLLRLSGILLGVFYYKQLNITILLYAIASTTYWFFLAIYVIKLSKINFPRLIYYSIKWIIPIEILLAFIHHFAF